MDVLSDHLKVLDHLPVIAELNIENHVLMLKTESLILNLNGTNVIKQGTRTLLVEKLVSSWMICKQKKNSCVHSGK